MIFNPAALWASLNLTRTGNILGIQERKEKKQEYKEKIEQNKRDYEKEPGFVREYRKTNGWAYARIREAHTGQELWRKRQVYGPCTLDAPAEAFETMDEFINANQP